MFTDRYGQMTTAASKPAKVWSADDEPLATEVGDDFQAPAAP
jgi:hypothetical protein